MIRPHVMRGDSILRIVIEWGIEERDKRKIYNSIIGLNAEGREKRV